VKVLVIDIGGSNIKFRVTGRSDEQRFESGPKMTAAAMVDGVKKLTAGWAYDVVAMGYPGVVKNDQPVTEPHNLAKGWVDFDYRAAFGKPVKMINDAAMQALGGYKQGKLLFLGLGTGLGSTMVVEGVVMPMELAHLPYRRKTFEDYVGEHALERDGKKKWRKHVVDVVARLSAALIPDDIVIGGGNVRHIEQMPPLCRAGDNENAFAGGFRMWAGAAAPASKAAARPAVKARPARKAAARKSPVKSPVKSPAKSQERRRSAAKAA
jgi:polyphosphate glucokinase